MTKAKANMMIALENLTCVQFSKIGSMIYQRYIWLLPDWIIEERVMMHTGRLYRVYYDPP
ncbi:hypothetical protein C1H46_007218 [Malus baccata]|uniref:Uncharacterized protein n=1 Tax=Malus baccata TaxID=106549 RepID=A0A540N7X7_MALBA|nr:hypothetical protein C1H46_007218 [Malus baccata]